MKKLVSIALIFLFTIGAFAQQEAPKKQKRKRANFTAEQIAELQTKKMALNLELSDSQQKQILAINKRNAVERKQKMEELKALKEQGKELSSDQLFELKNKQLDKQLAHQAEMKKILNEKQFETWKNSRNKRKHQAKRKMAKRKMVKRKMKHRKKGQRQNNR